MYWFESSTALYGCYAVQIVYNFLLYSPLHRTTTTAQFWKLYSFCHKIKIISFNSASKSINNLSPKIMMNDPVQYHLSPGAISELPILTKEDNYPSRQRLGYHLFLGYYFLKYGELSGKDKLAFLGIQ